MRLRLPKIGRQERGRIIHVLQWTILLLSTISTLLLAFSLVTDGFDVMRVAVVGCMPILTRWILERLQVWR